MIFKCIVLSLVIFPLFSMLAYADSTESNIITLPTNQENTINKVNSDVPEVNLKIEENTNEDKNAPPTLELREDSKQAEELKEPPFKAWLNGNYATGDWKGFRSKLEEKGITIGLKYINDNYTKLGGGLTSKSALKSLGLANISLTVDTKKLGLWPGGNIYVLGQNKLGHTLAEGYVGDLMLYDNWDAKGFTQLSEYWYEQSLFSDKLKVKLGKQDSTADFAYLGSNADFVNWGINVPTTVPVPTYPDPALGATVTLKPAEWIAVKTGIYDANANGRTLGFDTLFNGHTRVFSLNEIDLSHNYKKHPGNLKGGFWVTSLETEEITELETPREFGCNYGYYFMADQMLFKENQDSDEGLTVFGMLGFSPSDRNELSKTIAGGLSYKGLIPKRSEDITGVGIAFGITSGRLKNIDDMKNEAVIEVFHKFQLTPWFVLEPDFQVICNPGGTHNPAAVLLGLRTIVTF